MMFIFVLYVIAGAMVVLSLLVGIMAEHMKKVREQEREQLKQLDEAKKSRVKEMFHDAFDLVLRRHGKPPNQQYVDIHEFREMCQNPSLKSSLKRMNVDFLEDIHPDH